MTGYLQREIHTTVGQALKSIPVVVITGMRQTGKTTFLQNDPLFKRYRYVSLDDFATLQTAVSQPEALVNSGDPLCIDEAQKAPELLTAVKRAVDRQRKAGRFVLTGSANFSLLKGMSETLAGRAVYFTLGPLSRREIQGTTYGPFLVKLLRDQKSPAMETARALPPWEIVRGGMPPVASLDDSAAATWFRGFEQTYVERDIRDIARIDDTLGFRTLIKLATLRTGQLLNFSQLARDARLSLATTTRYLQLAETSFLFTKVTPFLRNRSSRLVKSPKLYLTDSGLACHLAGVESLENADEPLRGALFETYALQNISSILQASLPDAQISYWHVQGRHEVDFVLEHKKRCVAVEVKAASRWSESDLVSLTVFLEKTPSCVTGILAYNGIQTARLGKNVWAVPLATVLS